MFRHILFIVFSIANDFEVFAIQGSGRRDYACGIVVIKSDRPCKLTRQPLAKFVIFYENYVGLLTLFFGRSCW